jgi:hypothetical protein
MKCRRKRTCLSLANVPKTRGTLLPSMAERLTPGETEADCPARMGQTKLTRNDTLALLLAWVQLLTMVQFSVHRGLACAYKLSALWCMLFGLAAGCHDLRAGLERGLARVRRPP